MLKGSIHLNSPIWKKVETEHFVWSFQKLPSLVTSWLCLELPSFSDDNGSEHRRDAGRRSLQLKKGNKLCYLTAFLIEQCVKYIFILISNNTS